jgi:hydrogenase expression/formation protein HypD
MMLRFRDKSSADKIINRLAQMKLDMTLMHVCGTHQDTIIRYGLDNLLEEVGIDIRQGPGCPVCVTTTAEIELARTLAKRGKIVATYGDMLRVPATSGSLQDARS